MTAPIQGCRPGRTFAGTGVFFNPVKAAERCAEQIVKEDKTKTCSATSTNDVYCDPGPWGGCVTITTATVECKDK